MTKKISNKASSKKLKNYKEIWRRFKKSKTAVIGLILLVIIVFTAIFADLIVPYDNAINQSKEERLQGPSAKHWLGTDAFGRDMFARVVHGSRYSLLIGISTSLISLVVGGLLGAVAGYYGGRIDSIIMRIMDAFMCIPPILLSLAIVAALGPSLRNLLIAITISCVPSTTRIIRSTILTVVEQDFIEAAQSYGAKDFRIIIKYVLPNAIGLIIVNTTMGISSMILSAAGLSFIGMGIQPPAPEWGSLLSDAREYMKKAPYLMIGPGLSILIAALSFNLIGDGLRDALDPKLRD